MIEMRDQVRTWAIEGGLEQARCDVGEQHRSHDRERRTPPAPIAHCRRDQADQHPARRTAADPAYRLHEGDQLSAAMIDLE
jgi:hypothetical protein